MTANTTLSSAEPSSERKPGELARVLGLGNLIFIVVGTVIGSGVFLVPGAVLRQVDARAGVGMSIWVVGGVLSLLGALTCGELGAMMPEAGGLYVYIRDAFGPFLAFLYGWAQFTVIASGSIATLAVAARVYLGALMPLTPVMDKLVPIVVIAVFAAINIWEHARAPACSDWGHPSRPAPS